MILSKFRIKNFRTVIDSDWIDANDVTALIGENESGKTNLLIPLWKLNPAGNDAESKLNLLRDYPRIKYSEIKNASVDSALKRQAFVTALFELDENDVIQIIELIGSNSIKFNKIYLSRNYNDEIELALFQDDKDAFDEYLQSFIAKNKEVFSKYSGSPSIDKILTILNSFSVTTLSGLLSEKIPANTEEQQSDIDNFIDEAKSLIKVHSAIYGKDSKLIDIVPKFIYYSNYGNLDSEIYLPDIINEFDKDIYKGNKTKGRTLSTLFNYVNLSPKQIYDLGQPPANSTSEQVKKKQEENKERSVLLESASSSFTKSFNEWWGQGSYLFKFEADGNFFRIKVSDSLRTTPLELENRSSGLQWFFSFYLVFLVESKGLHKNAILLLDEPGVTLHPNSQKDLYYFFDNLAQTNQLIFTTHSPFMINPNQLDKVYAVYVNKDGDTEITADLRNTPNARQNNSIYPAHAALGLSVSDTLLQGCIPVIVEGVSDQIYFTLIKNCLIKNGMLNTQKEIVFIPSKGVKGIKAILAIVSGLNQDPYPYVIVDGDQAGNELKKTLSKELYAGNDTKILSIGDYCSGSETEDILPHDYIVKVIDSYLQKPEDSEVSFEDVVNSTEPLCNQIEKYAELNNIPLTIGYKVEIAKRLKNRILRKNEDLLNILTKEQKEFVVSIFQKITNN